MFTRICALLPFIVLFSENPKWNQAAKIAVNFDCAVMAAFVSYQAGSGTFNPTEGRIYVDGYYDDIDCYRDFPPWDLNIIFNTCGVREGVNFTVIFLHDKDYFLATIDEAQVFRCKPDVYETALHNVTAYVPAGEIIPIIGQVANVPGFNVSVTMVLKRTNDSSVIGVNSQPVTLGQNVTMELSVTQNDKVKIKASHCWAAGIIKNNTWKTLDLVTGGCPAVRFFSGFTQDPVDNHLTATFPMFLITPRHDTNRSTGFFCTVTACSVDSGDAECSESACSENEPGWGKRRKRLAGNMDGNQRPSDQVALGYFVDVIVESKNSKAEPSVVKFNHVFTDESVSTFHDKFCFNSVMFIAVASVMFLAVVILCGLPICFFVYMQRYRKYKTKMETKTAK
ncbi:uncharacterized protein LOC106164032 [Lingula anatina]|uniref:Uncharacterized protein LOC106164032 n=1 Tax=Lingula anatina TaxID=7574 RepID=A0A1S3IG53_LINAN|nr:uncharacterized protein LOC106164032 [Lingula anatina]|eukprot:XP_013397240.1 uncharacterized protein LOC106164032 [Lingula anatina]